MTPILTGIIASGISGHLTPPFSPAGAYDALASITLSSAASEVTFSNIPSGYKHLQIRMLQRDSNADTNVNSLYMYYNGDTNGNYSWHRIEALGSGTPSSSGYGNQGSMWIGPSTANNYTSGIFCGHIIDILDYSSIEKYKTMKHIGGFDTNGTGTEPGEIAFTSGMYMSKQPISSITIMKSGQNQVSGSTFALYGVK
jgi:hypothetical protein